MPDIRSFFTPKGGAAPKPAPAKSEDTSKAKRTSKADPGLAQVLKLTLGIENRKVIDDSDDDEAVYALTSMLQQRPSFD
jgi:replication factor C subunit 1